MMDFILWLIAGAVLGCLTTVIFHVRQVNLVVNIVLGMVGAFVAGYLLAPIFRFNAINEGNFNLPTLLVSLAGAGILLAVFNFFHRQKTVKNVVVERRWDEIRVKLHTRWGKLIEQDIAEINRNHGQLIVTLQKRYGYAKGEAEDKIQRFFKAVLNG
jgi:uncharacterized membrane protein YeaQ/YmgE (transglycosylase-associated protein family)/uncharacterized protein YjbJ (UPF0337 family)